MTHLNEGDKAPVFSGNNQVGKRVSLHDFEGKKVVLYFYPKDMTPGCTVESCNLRDNYTMLKENNIEIIGVSADSEKRHQRFIEKYDLPFDLLADENHEILKAYGVWGPKKFMGKSYIGIHRTTFVISENGIIEHVILKVKTKGHSEQIMELINA